jgi:hypothetical protein
LTAVATPADISRQEHRKVRDLPFDLADAAGP